MIMTGSKLQTRLQSCGFLVGNQVRCLDPCMQLLSLGQKARPKGHLPYCVALSLQSPHSRLDSVGTAWMLALIRTC